MFFFCKQETAYEIGQGLEFRRVLFRACSEAVPVGAGGMAAMIGPSVDEVRAICEEAAHGEILSVGNINAPGQVVIAGSKAAVDRPIALAKARGVQIGRGSWRGRGWTAGAPGSLKKTKRLS